MKSFLQSPAGSVAALGSDRGVVLVAVLWLLALLGGLAISMSMFTRSALSTIEAYNDRREATAGITAALDEAVDAVLSVAADETRPHPMILRGRRTRTSFEAIGETARIDVNFAPAELLAGLFVRLGVAPDVAAGYASLIVARRTPPRLNPSGQTPPRADAAQQLTAPAQVQPTQRPFSDVVQLEQLNGLPPSVIARAKPFITTFSGVPQIDPFLAAPEIIEALPGMTRERVHTVMELRGRPDATLESLSEALGDAKALAFSTQSLVTRIKVAVVLPDGAMTKSEIVVVHYPDDLRPYRVVSWEDEFREARRP